MKIQYKALDKLRKTVKAIEDIYIDDIIGEEKYDQFLNFNDIMLTEDEKTHLTCIYNTYFDSPFYVYEELRDEFDRNLIALPHDSQVVRYYLYFNEHLIGYSSLLGDNIPWQLREHGMEGLGRRNYIINFFLGIQELQKILIEVSEYCTRRMVLLKISTEYNTTTKIKEENFLSFNNLYEYFEDKCQCDYIIQKLLDEKRCQRDHKDNIRWQKGDAGNLASFLWYLNNKGYIKPTISFNEQTVMHIAEKYFGLPFQMRTAKNGKTFIGESKEFNKWLPLRE